MIQVTINAKYILKPYQSQPLHKEDFISLRFDDIVERIYVYKENKSESFISFGLTYPNDKGISLEEIESIAKKLGSLEKLVYPQTGYIAFQIKKHDEVISPFVILMHKHIFYFGLISGDYSRGPETKIMLLGVHK